MTISKDRAFEITDGVVVSDDSSGNFIEGPFYTGGPSSPVGLNLPENTFYTQNTASGCVLWQKFGSGVNDWVVYSSKDVSFDNSIANIPNSPANVQDALDNIYQGEPSFRFQYVQFQRLGEMDSNTYLFANVTKNSADSRTSGSASNGYRYNDSAPIVAAFSGNIRNGTASITGVAQSTGNAASNVRIKFELYKVGFSSEGTKLGNIIFDVDSSTYTVGDYWNTSILTSFADEQSQDVDVTEGDLLGLKFKSVLGNNKAVAVHNVTIVLELAGNVS